MSTLKMVEPIMELSIRSRDSIETPEVVSAAQEVLVQGLELLFDLGDHTYSQLVPDPFNASIGKHYRHVLEHFQCLIGGLRAGEVDYDARERNIRLETEVSYASVATCDVLRTIKSYRADTLARECRVTQSVSYENRRPSLVASNLGRELAYCAGHAIHHYAIVRLICSEIGIAVPAEFGFAPSTLKYMSSLAAD
jgi:hypothetical protein